jgi:hypothetical protein
MSERAQLSIGLTNVNLAELIALPAPGIGEHAVQ